MQAYGINVYIAANNKPDEAINVLRRFPCPPTMAAHIGRIDVLEFVWLFRECCAYDRADMFAGGLADMLGGHYDVYDSWLWQTKEELLWKQQGARILWKRDDLLFTIQDLSCAFAAQEVMSRLLSVPGADMRTVMVTASEGTLAECGLSRNAVRMILNEMPAAGGGEYPQRMAHPVNGR